MHRLAVATALLAPVALAACKDDKKSTAAVAASDAAAKPPGDAAAAAQPPELPPAGPPPVATADDCKKTGEYATATLREAAEARQVPAAKLDATAKDLSAAFIEQCQKEAWPGHLLDCIGKAPPGRETYERCFDRLPATQFVTWMERADAIIAKAGGTAAERPAPASGEGVAFEELCAGFVAEMARLDDCTGPGMYVPEFEAVFRHARGVAVGGLIPADAQDKLKTACDERAVKVRTVTAQMCQPTPPAP